jgi:hypothetical protein
MTTFSLPFESVAEGLRFGQYRLNDDVWDWCLTFGGFGNRFAHEPLYPNTKWRWFEDWTYGGGRSRSWSRLACFEFNDPGVAAAFKLAWL